LNRQRPRGLNDPIARTLSAKSDFNKLFEPTVFRRKKKTKEIREKNGVNAMFYFYGRNRRDAIAVVSCTYFIERIIKMCLGTVGLASLRKSKGE